MEELIEENNRDNYWTSGKYLFFSDNKKLLIEIAEKILLEYDLYHAKVPSSDIKRGGNWYWFVLCVYDSSPKFRIHLQKFEEEWVAYRYWKSNDATARWEYVKM